MRQLASVVTVDKVWNLEGKDRVQGCSFKENSYEALVDKSIKENNFDTFIKLAEDLKLNTVPVLATYEKMKELFPNVKKAEEFAEAKYWKKDNFNYTPKQNQKLWKHYFQHEGIVVRTIPYDKTRNLGTSFKIKNLEYQEKGLGTIHALAGVEYGK